MENSEEAVDDDQGGSGWLEVKKKHRSSSKFSLQGWVGGSSGKQSSKFLHSQPLVNEKVGKSHGKHRYSLQKAGGDFATPHQGSFTDRVPVSSNKGSYYHDKCIINQDNKCATPPPSLAMIVNNTNSRTGDIQEVPQKDTPVATHKIKWGDIEDDALVLRCEKTAGAEIKFGDIDNDNLMVYRTSGYANNMISCRSSSTEVQGNELVKTSGDVDIAPHQMHSLCHRDVDIAPPQMLSSSPRDKSSEENCKEVNKLSLKHAEVHLKCDRVVDEQDHISNSNELRDRVVDEQDDVSNSNELRDRVVDEKDDVSNCKEIHHEHVKPVDGDPLIFSCSSGEEVYMMEKLEVPDESEVGVLKTSEEAITDGGPITVVISQATELCAGKSGPETHAESSMTTYVEECRGSQDSIINDEMSRAQMTGDLGEGVGDAGESKERFRQRLWCFLFENLNRAVDELYLLCELECDLEQVKEAILVLQESASDFKELKSRVQEFENVKKSSPQLLDGKAVTLKTDHRRPHALSWEVRRMTTSPHRAEILASSLEAFKKIQHERASMGKATNARTLRPDCPTHHHISGGIIKKSARGSEVTPNAKDSGMKSTKQSGAADLTRGNLTGDKRNIESGRSGKVNLVQNGYVRLQKSSIFDPYASRLSLKDSSAASNPGKSKKEQSGLTTEKEKLLPKKDKLLIDSSVEKNPKFMDQLKRHISLSEKDKEKRIASSWNSMDAWKEKRNWEDILTSPFRVSSRVSHSPGMSRKSAERARILRDKLMSPEKKKKNATDLKKEAEEKHARAMRIRGELENERVQKLQRTSEKLNRVNEWQAVRSMKLREGMDARHQRSVSRHEAFLAQVVRRAGDESSKVNEVRFITSLNEESKKFMLRQKHHDSELRRAEKLQVMKSKQREDIAREEAVLERRKLIEAEKLQRLAEIQRKKEEAQVRREEERRLSSVAREAKAIEQLRKKEIRAKAQQEEAELLAQKLAERLSESEQRRKFYLEQIRERASMDFRDQSSPLLRRSLNKESQGRSTPTNNGDDCLANIISGSEGFTTLATNVALQHSLKRRIKKIRQRLMALKYEFLEPPVNNENSGIGYRTAVGTARAKIGRWLQELQRLRQARKEGAASIGLITAEMVKFLEGRDPELFASRQAGLLDFIASALPASHTSKPEACLVTIYLLRVLRVVLSLPANRSYFLSQNLLPPIIPMLAAALENYIKIAASLNVPGGANSILSKTTIENFESISEVLDGFLWTVTTIIGHVSSDQRQLQMQDGLLELVVAYQVIHRLRDLFALYDRPQVEGSPFPSSILLSINLLMVLTSRPRTTSSIDWESFPSATGTGNDIKKTTLLEPIDVGFSIVNDYGGDCRPPLSIVNGSVVMHLPDVPEDRPLDESCKTNRSDESGSVEKGPTSLMIELNDVNQNTTDAKDESQKNVNNAKLLEPRKDEKSSMDSGVEVEQKNENSLALKQPLAFLLSAISETGLVSLPSLLTAVLLQANNRLSSEQASYVLPSNFEEVAAGVLKVLNNLALIDITLMQKMLARPDLKMEFFHLMSFLLSHCTSKWKVAGDQVGLLLLESLLLLGYFALFHPGNQAVLRWGKSPTILHKVCDLPFVFFSDPDLMPVLAGTLVAACYGCEQNKGVVQQELSVDMLLSLLTSCKNSLRTVQSNLTRDQSPTDDSGECNQLAPESKKFQVDTPLRPSRYNTRSARVSLGKGSSYGNSSRIAKIRSQRDIKATKGFEDYTLKQNQRASENSSILMLHCRFPRRFIDRAEQFFSASSTNLHDEA